MTLHEYLQSEQAREDVRKLLDSCDGAENSWADKTVDGGFHWMTEDAGAWWRVGLEDSHAHNVYYRPDGDLYIVTDVGEGYRSAVMRGFDRTKHMSVLMGLTKEMPPGFDTDAPLGTIELRDVAAETLPDAICRVMLASLRVAEVTP